MTLFEFGTSSSFDGILTLVISPNPPITLRKSLAFCQVERQEIVPFNNMASIHFFSSVFSNLLSSIHCLKFKARGI